MTTEIIFWGATGHAKVLYELIEGTQFKLVALVDSRYVSPPFPGIPLLVGESGLDDWLSSHPTASRYAGAVAVGGDRGTDRIALRSVLERRGLEIVTLIHRTAFVARGNEVGAGTQILAGVNLCAGVSVGRSVIINTAASIDHGCSIADGVHIGPGARVAGEVRIDERAFVGVGATILPRIHIGHDAIVGAGAVVTRDVPPGIVVAGNPARKLRDVNAS
jgi:sugar O-acyltransferase (sialic acid O-acetyltransferase NeuD family)